MHRIIHCLTLLILLVPVGAFSQGTPGLWTGDYSIPRGCSWHVLAMDSAADGKVYLSLQGNVCGQESGTLFAYDPVENDFTAVGEFSSTLFDAFSISTIRSAGSDIYLGGSFTHIDDMEVNGIARLDTQTGTFHALGQGDDVGITDGFWIRDILIDDDDLFVAGAFHEIGGIASQGVAGWDRTQEQWHEVGGGITGDEFQRGWSLGMGDDGTLYLGGEFSEVGNQPADNIAAWDGLEWAGMGTGTNSRVDAIVTTDDSLFIGGQFFQAGGGPAAGMAEWDGEDWQQVGSGLGFPTFSNARVVQMAVSDGYLYVSGFFTSIDGAPANYLARKNLTTGDWSALGTEPGGGLSGSSAGLVLSRGVEAFTFMGDHLYVGGDITRVDGQAANNIARYDLVTEQWSPIGQDTGIGMNAQDTWQVEFTNRGLMVFGPMSQSGLVRSFHFARRGLADNQWSNFGDNDERFFIFQPRSALELGEDLYMAGSMAWLSHNPPESPTLDEQFNHIARWNPDESEWEPLIDANTGTIGVGAPLHSMAGHDDWIYVSGNTLSSAGGVSANYIARWNTSTETWAPLGDGLDHFARTLTVDDSGLLYAGGFFETAGGQPAYGVAVWDPNTEQWSALGDGITNSDGSIVTIWALALTDDGDLLVGGEFDTAGTTPVNSLARWDGSQWHDFGDGVTDGDGEPGLVRAIEVTESGEIFVGGLFTQAGGLEVSNLARWDGTQWSRVGNDAESSGVGGQATQGVRDLALRGPNLVVAGWFSQAGGEVAANFAHFVRDLGGADLEVEIEVDELSGPSNGDPQQLSLRGMTSGLLYTVEVRNLGMNFANNVEFSIDADPMPESAEWTCQPFAGTDAACPQASGNGLPNLVFNLPGQSGLRFEILVSVDSDDPYEQALSASASGDQVFDGDNTQSGSSSSTTVNDRIFSDRFE